MARALAIASAAALLSAVGAQDSEYTAQFMGYYMKPGCVPSTDKCCVDCNQLCTAGLSQGILKPPASCGKACGMPAFMVNSQKYCLEACIAHSIQTTRPASGFSGPVQQGKYVQKVIAEYCSRGLCKGKGGLAQEAVDIQKHQQGEGEGQGEAWKVPAKSSGWPKSCESSSYFCDQLCANMYHETSKQLGPHPGADENWPKNKATCAKNCKANWGQVKTYFDGFCACSKSKGAPSLPPGFLQEEAAESVDGEAEEVDVGSFVQVPAEL